MSNFKNGYFVQDCEKIESLEFLKLKICNLIREEFQIDCSDDDKVLNNFHEFVNGISDIDLNDKRISLINKINKNIDFKELIFTSFKNTILNLLGPDLLVQKNCNIVIQRPNDNNPSELHRDAPGNSAYEIVIWIPLVDCYKTKGMYIVDYESTCDLYDDLEKNQDWEHFEKKSIKKSSSTPVSFGEALFFSTAILHGSHINQENETRISLNIRFKNIFSPSGLKNQLQFFEKFRVSEFVRIGSNLESKKMMVQNEQNN
tara:strand:- start:19 stop:795 length:777 start_codon:yes stop_codon:yes gene_type:complete